MKYLKTFENKITPQNFNHMNENNQDFPYDSEYWKSRIPFFREGYEVEWAPDINKRKYLEDMVKMSLNKTLRDFKIGKYTFDKVYINSTFEYYTQGSFGNREKFHRFKLLNKFSLGLAPNEMTHEDYFKLSNTLTRAIDKWSKMFEINESDLSDEVMGNIINQFNGYLFRFEHFLDSYGVDFELLRR